jgi:hypothetical protein
MAASRIVSWRPVLRIVFARKIDTKFDRDQTLPWHPWGPPTCRRIHQSEGTKGQGGELPWSTTHRGGAAGPKLAAALPSPRDELLPVHSITSSAPARKASGIVTPIAFAVLRLTTSSNLVVNWTGSSLGFAPRRMRST